MSGYVTGSLGRDADAANRCGWLIGAFADGPWNTAALEVKSWAYSAGQVVEHGVKVSTATEFTLILDGAVEALIDGQTHVLRTGDYALIHPGARNCQLNQRHKSTPTDTPELLEYPHDRVR